MHDVRLIPAHAPLRVAGKVALVTGGGRGIGAAIAIELATQGAAVAIGYRNSHRGAGELAKRLVDAGYDAMAWPIDMSSRDQIRETFARIVERWGGLDILVNNAGMTRSMRVDEIGERDLDQMLDVNVKGPFLAIQAALPHMRTGGRVVNIGSISSDYMPYPGNALYVMTKSALAGLTRGLARELAERDITINTVQPGRVDTQLLREALGNAFEQVRAQTPLGRFGDVAEVAHMVAFLCSDAAGYVTGANLRIDGGVSV